MGNNRSKTNSFVIQGSILAFAGIMVRVIGLLYRIPLNRILGAQGLGYYTTAFEVYNILILLSSQSMPLAVSKIVSEKLERRQYRNAHKVFKGAMIYALLLGGVLGLVAFIGADWIAVTFYKLPQIAVALRILAPTLTVSCVLGVLRGYFQGMGNMAPTAISQLVEQIINAFVSVIAAYELGSFGYTLSKIESKSKVYQDTYAAAGGTLGTLAGAIAALVILVLVLYNSRNVLSAKRRRDRSRVESSYQTIMKVIFFTITPVLISTTIYNIGNLLDNPIYQNIMNGVFKLGEKTRSARWGIYSGYYKLLTTMPIAIASALSTAIVPSLVRSYISGDRDVVRTKVGLALKFSMIIAFPCGVGLSVLGGPINELLFRSKEAASTTGIMAFSVFTVVFFSLSTISNAILQGIDKLQIPIINSAMSLAIHLIVLPVLLIVFHMDIYAVVVGDFLFAGTMVIFNAKSIKKFLGYRQDWIETFAKPFVCSAVMGIGCYIVYIAIRALTRMPSIATLFAIIVSIVIYGVMLVVSKTITEDELESMPKGEVLIGLFKKVHLL